MRTNRWRIACVWLLIAALIAALFLTGILDRQKVWPDLKQEYQGGDNLWRIRDGDAYGRVASGPYIDLPVGTYRIKWQIEGDAANRITFSCSNDAKIMPSEIMTDPDKWQDEAWFEIQEHTHSFSVNVEFSAGTWMQVHNIRLYSPEYRDRTFTAAALIIAMGVLLTMYLSGKLTRQNMQELTVMVWAILFASLLCLGENSPLGWDTHFHAARIVNLADSLRSGQLPARVGGFSYNGYGAMTSVFYPDLLLYPWALMLLGGASMSYVINTLVVAVNVLSVWSMMIAGKRLIGNRQAALCASVLYLFSIYRLEDVYTRLMVGEMLAMAFLPLFILGLYEVVLGDKRRWTILVVSATLVFRSHMLTTVLCACVAAAMGLLFIRKIICEKRLGAIALAGAATLLININQIVPFVMCYAGGVNTSNIQFGFAGAALSLIELMDPAKHMGIALVFGVIAFVCAQESKEERASRRVLWLILLAGAGCAVLTTELIPWAHISEFTGGLVDILQFPWRFLVFTAVCFALCGGDGIWRMVRGGSMQAAVLTLVIAVMCAMPHLKDMPPYVQELEFGQSAKTYMVYPEYQIAGTNVEDTRSRAVLTDGDVQLTDYVKEGTRVSAQVSAATDSEIAFPLFGFPGYEVKFDGEPVAWYLSGNNRLTVDIPAGSQGLLEIFYAGKTIWKIADIVSACAAAALGVWMVYQRKKVFAKKKNGV